jgi:hypothetical protein
MNLALTMRLSSFKVRTTRIYKSVNGARFAVRTVYFMKGASMNKKTKIEWFVRIARCERCRTEFDIAELKFNVCEPCYVRTYGEVGVDYFDEEQCW